MPLELVKEILRKVSVENRALGHREDLVPYRLLETRAAGGDAETEIRSSLTGSSPPRGLSSIAVIIRQHEPRLKESGVKVSVFADSPNPESASNFALVFQTSRANKGVLSALRKALEEWEPKRE